MNAADLLSLLNVVFVVVLIALWWGLYDAAHPPPDAERDPFMSLAMSGILVGGVPPQPASTVPDGLDHVLSRIANAGGYRAVPDFIKGAKQAYELIVPAVARGDLAGVGNLLTDQVAHDFQAFADGRRQRGETEALLFIGFSGADVIAASFDDVASLDVRFSADIVSVTRDRDGRIIEGSPDRVIRVAEIWTFERDLKTPKSRWLLAATDADE
jgi:predicted lipid-binding transport protein (Tim44 family)